MALIRRGASYTAPLHLSAPAALPGAHGATADCTTLVEVGEMRIKYKMLWLGLAAAAGCHDHDADNGAFVDASVQHIDAGSGSGTGGKPDAAPPVVSYVYVESNNPAGNAVLELTPNDDGTFTSIGAVATGGLGLGAGSNQRLGPLDSDRELALSLDGTQVYAVNSGDRTI